ncbi:MAG: polysaccharide pyruvyl transferase family protein [Bacteroidia bacterium]|nr:polysaccharide pyruvyl transferase family protein [Bacteroidia bacterium]
MPNIGILTFHKSINYGAVLQVYALNSVLDRMGYIAEIVDYDNPKHGMHHFSTKRRIAHHIWHKGVKIFLVGKKREKRTEQFRRKYFTFSSHRYLNSSDLRNTPPIYDFYITGSDQVWNPQIQGGDTSYFLTFAPKDRKRISYGASFGVSILPEKYKESYAQWIKELNFISVREIEGKRIVKELTGREAEIVLDPTLLLSEEEWRQVSTPFSWPKKYILCYYMPGDKQVNRLITEVARKISRETGLSIISIGQKEYMRLNLFRNSIFDAGPAEFLGLLQNASFVVTNSFHGTAFAVNFKKPFYVPVNTSLSPEKALSSRITTLLKTIGLENRLIPAGSEIPGELAWEIDFQEPHLILQEEKKKSIEFLRKALQEGSHEEHMP